MPAMLKPPTRGKKNIGRTGRPKTWTGPLIREMIALDIHTNFTNDELLRSLREGGTRSLQGQRKRLLGNKHQRWRPRNPQQMHRRIRHLQAQDRPGTGPRQFSLDCSKHRQQASSVTSNATVIEDNTPQSLPLQKHDVSKVIFHLVRQVQEDSGEVKQLRIRKTNIGDTSSTDYRCDISEIEQKLKEICQQSIYSKNDQVLFSWSVVLSDINLSMHELLKTGASFKILRNRISKLALNHCRLCAVPPPVKFFTRLRYLNLRRNRLLRIAIESLPKSLTHLDLRNNEILELPKDLLSLGSLQILAVSHNLIKELPSWLSQWTSLHSLLINGNPLNMLSQLYYTQAFQHCVMDTKFESCTLCIRLATETLKHIFSPNCGGLSAAANQPRSCDCSSKNTSTITQLTLVPNGSFRSFEADLLRTPVYSRGATSLRDFLDRMSLLSGSTRSSVSEHTLKSLSSIGSRRRLSCQDIQSLMHVHCCFRETGDTRPLCMHFRIAKWINSRGTGNPPLWALKQLDPLGNSALHIAADFGASPAALQSCIECGCPPSIINHDGETFLHRVFPSDWNSQAQHTLNLGCLLYTMKFPFEHLDNRGNSIFHRPDRSSPQQATWRPEFDFKTQLQLYNLGKAFYENKVLSSRVYFECRKHRPRAGNPIRLFVEAPTTTHLKLLVVHESTSCVAECSRTQRNALHELADLTYLGYEIFLISRDPLECNLRTVLSHILAVGVDVNEYNDQGLTVLMAFIRAFNRHRKLSPIDVEHYISSLLSSGANARAISSTGNTVLHLAVYYGIPFAIEPLIKAGANVNARNGKGLSVWQLLTETMTLHKANIHLYGQYQQCMAILADHGAEMDPTLKQELQWQSDPTFVDRLDYFHQDL